MKLITGEDFIKVEEELYEEVEDLVFMESDLPLLIPTYRKLTINGTLMFFEVVLDRDTLENDSDLVPDPLSVKQEWKEFKARTKEWVPRVLDNIRQEGLKGWFETDLSVFLVVWIKGY